MEHHDPPYSDFLRDIVELHGKVSEDIFARLFVNVLALHGGQELQVTAEMIKKAMESLSSRAYNIHAAFGLLRLAFQNDITFTDFPLDLLLNFKN
jgi:hypothetical protein